MVFVSVLFGCIGGYWLGAPLRRVCVVVVVVIVVFVVDGLE